MKLLTEAQELADLAGACVDSPWLAMDTEFMREKTYFPELCLLQIGLPDQIALVDTMALKSLEPLAAVLAERQIIKLMHAPRQDLEVLEPIFGRELGPLFDTQLAAALCGEAPQASYATVVQDLLDIDVGASHARTDWSRRPLRPEQLDYAAADVRHLPAVHEVLRARLVDNGRLGWLEEEMRALEALPLYVEPAKAWKRVKGGGTLAPEARERLRVLAAWREEEAVTSNRPRQWVVADGALLEIARCGPTNLAGLTGIEGLNPRISGRYGAIWLELMAGAPPPEAGQTPPPEPDRQLVKRLQALVRTRAAELLIDPTVLATRADVAALAVGETDNRLLRGWRREVIGERLAAEVPAS